MSLTSLTLRKEQLKAQMEQINSEIDQLFATSKSTSIKDQINAKVQEYSKLEHELFIVEDDIIINQIVNDPIYKNNSHFTAELVIINSPDVIDVKMNYYVTNNSILHALSDADLHANETFNKSVINIWMTIEADLIVLHGFYSLAMIRSNLLDLLSNNDKHMMKGLAYSSLCYILNYMRNYTQLPEQIELSAEGEIPGKDMSGLINYYKSIGFEEKGFSDSEGIRMYGNVTNILSKCPSNIKHKITELDKIIRVIVK